MVLFSKNRGKKLPITDVAIQKIPYIEFLGKNKDENILLQKASALVLNVSKYNNNNNEVAVTLDLSDGAFELDDYKQCERLGISLGEEHSVNVFADTRSFHIISQAKKCAVAISHNHPSTQTFSLEDINFFVTYYCISLFIVVSNQGTIHYLQKTEKYDYNKAKALYNQCIKKKRLFETQSDYYNKALEFLKNCIECGILYK